MRARVKIRRFSTSLPPAATVLAANAFLAAAAFLTSVIQARILAPEGRGIFAQVILWPSILSQLSLLGVQLYLAREAGRNPSAARVYYSTGYTIAGLSSVTALAAWLIYALVIAPNYYNTGTMVILLSAAYIPFSAWNALQVHIELGRASINTYNFARLSFGLLHLCFAIILSVIGFHTIEAFTSAFTMAAALAAVATFIRIHGSLRSGPHPQQVVRRPSINALYRGARPYAVSTMLLSLWTMADKIIVSAVFPPAAMGVYVVAFALSQLQPVINEAISPLFFARTGGVSSIAALNKTWLASRLRQAALINAATCLGISLSAPLFLPIVYGHAYLEALPISLILIPAVGIRSLMRPFEEILKGGAQASSHSIALALMLFVLLSGAAVAAITENLSVFAGFVLLSSAIGLISVVASVSRATDLPPLSLLVPQLRDLTALIREIRATLSRAT